MSQVFDFQRGDTPARSRSIDHPGKPPSSGMERRRSPRINGLHLFISLALAAAVAVVVDREAAKLDEPSFSNLFWHFAAWPSCEAARAFGLDQAKRGAPGYWLSHDRDRDGIACEPFGESPVFFQR